MSDSQSVSGDEALRDALRRMLETDGRCCASLWLRDRDGELYCWDSCNAAPGHDGPHTVWSDREGCNWATWDPGPPSSPYVDISAAEARPSPWTPDEIAALRSVGTPVGEWEKYSEN